jgi:hypothetical protein
MIDALLDLDAQFFEQPPISATILQRRILTMKLKLLSGLLASLALACGGENNNNNNGAAGTADVTSDPINGVTASAAFSFAGGIVSNDLDLDQDGAQDDSTVAFVAIFTDLESFCDDLNASLLSGNSDALANGIGGNAVVVTTVKKVFNSQSDLTDGENFLGDAGDITVNVTFVAADETAVLADTESEDLGSLNLTFDAATTSFSGNFSAILTLDTSGQAAFDVDTDADGAPDATAIDANISGNFEGAQICGGVEGIALLLGLFAGF